jgi:hypothetical protein
VDRGAGIAPVVETNEIGLDARQFVLRPSQESQAFLPYGALAEQRDSFPQRDFAMLESLSRLRRCLRVRRHVPLELGRNHYVPPR